MRVLEPSRSWNSRVVRRQRRLFGSAITALSVVAVLFAAANMWLLAKQSVLTMVITSNSVETHSLVPRALAEAHQSLLPEQGDFGDELFSKLTTPLPPPAPNCAAEACIALTFDDGPNADSTAKILDALDKGHVEATFFLIGNRVEGNAGVVQRIAISGYAIGNHSWAHPDFTRLSAARMQQQVDMAQAAIMAAGVPAPTLFRPPYGSRNNLLRQTVRLPIILWNVDPKDWHETDPNKIVESVEAQAKPGAIILLHDRAVTADAMPKIIHDLKSKYRLVTVNELLNLAPDATGEFFGR